MDNSAHRSLGLVRSEEGEGDARLSEQWVECEVVAKEVGLSTKTIYRLADTCPGFPVIRVGGRQKRFVVSQVKRYFLEHAEEIAKASKAHSMRTSLSAARRNSGGAK